MKAFETKATVIIMENKYILSVPIMYSVNKDAAQREKTLAELKRCGAKRVFVAFASIYADMTYAEPFLVTAEENGLIYKISLLGSRNLFIKIF